MFGRKPPRVAVVSPGGRGDVSPLDPMADDENARKWTYYHRCLEPVGPVRYYPPAEWAKVAGCGHVFVHESLYDALGPERTVEALARLKRENGRLTWVELHEKSVYSGALFLPGFFDHVDLVLKHQMVGFDFLKEELSRPANRLAPHFLYGVGSYREFIADRRFFGFRIPADLLDSHIRFDFPALASRIRPIMYPFSWRMLEGGAPSYRAHAKQGAPFSYAGRIHPNHVQRNALVAFAASEGLPVSWSEDYLRCLERSRFFLALGHIHSSQRTFDALGYDTVLVHYSPGPYVLWDEFVEGRNYLGCGDVTRIFGDGGFGMDESYAREALSELSRKSRDAGLVRHVLEGQRALFDLVSDPAFIRAKLGVEAQ